MLDREVEEFSLLQTSCTMSASAALFLIASKTSPQLRLGAAPWESRRRDRWFELRSISAPERLLRADRRYWLEPPLDALTVYSRGLVRDSARDLCSGRGDLPAPSRWEFRRSLAWQPGRPVSGEATITSNLKTDRFRGLLRESTALAFGRTNFQSKVSGPRYNRSRAMRRERP